MTSSFAASSCVLIPVYNEEQTLSDVLDQVRVHHDGLMIVVDDGSEDATPDVLACRDDVMTVTHDVNVGYGASLIDGFALAGLLGVSKLVTMDCDGQHEPKHIPEFLAALDAGDDIVSGSRYLPGSTPAGRAPEDRRRVNGIVTEEVNRVTGWGLTDAFCGFKSYRMEALDRLELSEPGYAMPLELWARAWQAGLRVREIPVERIYFDHDRSFGEDLDDPDKRLSYYLEVWNAAMSEVTL